MYQKQLTSTEKLLLATLKLALNALNSKPRFKVGNTDSYKIASACEEVIESSQKED